MGGVKYPQEFLYSPLGLGEFRISILNAAADNDSIDGYLLEESLENNPRYNALSYAWGSISDAVEQLVVDGVVIMMRDPVPSALRTLRSETTPKVFWVDALCIDQSNLAERSHQEQQMGYIYQQASVVQV